MAKGFLDGYKTYDASKGYRGNADQWRQLFEQRMGRQEAAAMMGDNPEHAARELLEITEEATPQAIKHAYRKKLRLWHPDTNPHRTAEANTMTRRIIAAYVLLTEK